MTGTGVRDSHNMRLIAHDPLAGHGNGGEGLALHVKDGRRTLFVAHEGAPVNFSAVDVTDPTDPRVIVQTVLPHDRVRSNSLSLQGDLLAVAYQTATVGEQPAGVEFFDVSNPDAIVSVGFFDASGPRSRGAHFVWLDTEGYAYLATGMPDFSPAHELDDQIVVIVDVRNPADPTEVGRWWLPGTSTLDGVAPRERLLDLDTGNRPHNINVYPERPDRAYIGYIDAGVVILDISDRTQPKLVSHLDYHPPMHGMSHSVVPLFERDLLVITEETVVDGGADHPKHLWLADVSNERRPLLIASAPHPPVSQYAGRGGRFGMHNVHENDPIESAWSSDTTLVAACFNAGVRVYDISDPFRIEEVAFLVPDAPVDSPAGAVQINDVYVDENRVIYAIDRFTGGLYILELEPSVAA